MRRRAHDSIQRQTPHRQFHYTPAILARREKKIPTLSKKQLAAKERKRAKKAPKSIYDGEKMTLSDAVEVLRVRRKILDSVAGSHLSV